MRQPGQRFLFLFLFVTGLAVWWVISTGSGETEAWDSIWYYALGLPMMLGASAIAGYRSPGHAWRWGLAVVLAQPLLLLLQGETGPLLAAGMVLFFVPAALATGAAWLGGWVRRRTNP